MNRQGKPIPVLESVDFDDLVKHMAIEESRTVAEVLNFISHRSSLQAGLELLGVPLLVTGPCVSERNRAEPLLQSFEDYLLDKGCKVPELMWEPVGLTITAPGYNEEIHEIAKRRPSA